VEQTLTIDAKPRSREEPVWPEKLGELFDEHQARLYRLARRLSSDPEEARDLVQEAFLRAARSPGRVPDGAAAEAWLVRVVVNLCRDGRRRQMVRRRPLAEPAPQQPGSPEAAAVARATVQAALVRLSPRRRAVVALHELEGTDVAEVARLLGVARVTVRWHLAAARRDLKQILGVVEPADERRGSPRRKRRES
jgi:RNA polymerase sigma-70 factor (ECF subfamily)